MKSLPPRRNTADPRSETASKQLLLSTVLAPPAGIGRCDAPRSMQTGRKQCKLHHRQPTGSHFSPTFAKVGDPPRLQHLCPPVSFLGRVDEGKTQGIRCKQTIVKHIVKNIVKHIGALPIFLCPSGVRTYTQTFRETGYILKISRVSCLASEGSGPQELFRRFAGKCEPCAATANTIHVEPGMPVVESVARHGIGMGPVPLRPRFVDWFYFNQRDPTRFFSPSQPTATLPRRRRLC